MRGLWSKSRIAEVGVAGKTGMAPVSDRHSSHAWFVAVGLVDGPHVGVVLQAGGCVGSGVRS